MEKSVARKTLSIRKNLGQTNYLNLDKFGIGNDIPDCQLQGGHKPGKHGKPGKLREFEKLSNSQGKLREI